MTILKTLIISIGLLFAPLAVYANDESTGTGTVAETMNVGAYVYVRLAEDGIWVASTPVPVAVGDTVKYAGGALMKNFYSSKLDRTFDSVLFVMNLEVSNQISADAHAAAAADDPHGIAKSETAVAPKAGEIEPVAGGMTVDQIYTQRAQLQDQKVSLRGRVMKVSLNIMGKNWITVQDGTGTAPGDKIIATSNSVAKIGDLVTVTGVIHSNVDLGSGYNYKVLLEEANFVQ